MGDIMTRFFSTAPQMDDSTNREMWQRIVENSMVGIGVFSHAAICDIDSGKIFACAPKEFDPTVLEVKQLVSAVLNPSEVSGTGIKVDKHFFKYNTGQVGQTLYGKDLEDDQRGIIITMGNKCMVIAIYPGNEKDAKKMLSELVEYFCDNYEF